LSVYFLFLIYRIKKIN